MSTEALTKHKLVVDFSENLVKEETIGAIPMTSCSMSQGLSFQHVTYIITK